MHIKVSRRETQKSLQLSAAVPSHDIDLRETTEHLTSIKWKFESN